MATIFRVRRPAPSVALAAVLLMISLTGCGKDGPSAASSTSSTNGPTSTGLVTTISVTSLAPTSTTRTTLGTVPTTTTPPLAEQAVDRSLLRDTTNMSADFNKATMNGVSYTNALLLEPFSSGERRVEIDAGRSHKRFLGDLGIPDSEKSTSAYKVEISLDNAAPTFSTELRFGETKKIDLDVTNVLRIKIVVSPIVCCGYLAIGSPRFV